MQKIIPVFIFFLCSLFALRFTSFSYADTATGHYQTKASKTTAVGAGGGNSGVTGNIATYADALAKAIIGTCPNISIPIPGYALVSTQTLPCIDPLNNTSDPVLKTNTIRDVVLELQASTKSFGLLQCVGFADAVAGGTGKVLPANQANAIDFAKDFPSEGYKWYPRGQGIPQPGDFAIWSPNHIAVILSVPNPDTIKIAEANGGSGSVGEETYPTTAVNYYGVVYQGFLRRL